MTRVHTAGLLLALAICSASAQQAFKPTAEELKAGYQRANDFHQRANGATFNLTLTHGWIGNGESLWYRVDKPGNRKEFIRGDAVRKTKSPAFDHKALATALTTELGRSVSADQLPFQSVAFNTAGTEITFGIDRQTYKFTLATGKVEKSSPFEGTVLETQLEEERTTDFPAPYFGDFAPIVQAQEGGTVRVREGQVEVRSGNDWNVVTKQGSYARAQMVAEGKKVLAFRLLPGERKLAYLLKAAISGSTRAVLEQRMYDQPGDRLDEYETWLIDPSTKTESKVEMAPIMGGGQPWSGPPGVRPRGGKVFFSFPIRGYQEHRIVSLEPNTGAIKTIVQEKSPTFIDQSKTNYWLIGNGEKLIWQSERSGWNHLYMIDTNTGNATQITKGNWVVRGVSHVDEAKGQIWFTASGLGDVSKEDPYHIQAARINFDGSGFVQLTRGDGTHAPQFSPNRRFLVDTYSRVDLAPVHELRSAENGELILSLGKGEIEGLQKNGVKLPERFVSKGRDGKTDIWGMVILPTNFDPKRKYPVIEYIYAGPHDSFVPKSFRPFHNMHRLAELGFIVVQIDGMGTNNRGKAFHDVAWKNVADAGFPDRILWMQALSKKYPQLDLTRVGIYGTSAGGQSSTGAVLFHPEFYKVAVSSCGCHDNRIDKQWWNEQWMGYPIGPHYDQQSNITNAAKLKGRLMLIVGEQDRNVPPETTFRLADSLIKANKDFELVVIPGADHTDGGPYGERKRRDYFVRWLHGVEPPLGNN